MNKIMEEIIKVDKTLGNSVKKLSLSQDEFAKQISSIARSLVSINNKLGKLDIFFSDDMPKRYGFDKDKMYYIGTASGYTYKKPINKTAVEMIKDFDKLNWKEIQSLNNYFRHGTRPKRRADKNVQNS